MWGRQRVHSAAKGEDVSLGAQLAAEVSTSSDAAVMQHAAGPEATTLCAPGPGANSGFQAQESCGCCMPK